MHDLAYILYCLVPSHSKYFTGSRPSEYRLTFVIASSNVFQVVQWLNCNHFLKVCSKHLALLVGLSFSIVTSIQSCIPNSNPISCHSEAYLLITYLLRSFISGVPFSVIYTHNLIHTYAIKFQCVTASKYCAGYKSHAIIVINENCI